MDLSEKTNENDAENLKLVVVELEKELTTVKADLDGVQKNLARVERLYEKSMTCNEVLRQRVEELSAKLQQYQSGKASLVDATVQVDELELTANTSRLGTEGEALPTILDTPPLSEPNTSRCGADGEALPADWGNTPTSEANKTTCHHGGEGRTDEWANASAATEPQEEADKPTSTTSIADMVKAAAEEALETSGVVYHAESGMYYDYNTGYYHDPERSLYYEPCSGTYYYYDQVSQQYVFHSQIDVSQYSTAAYSNYHDKHGDSGTTQEHKDRSRKKKSRKNSSKKEEARRDHRKMKKRKKENNESSVHKHKYRKEKDHKHHQKHKRKPKSTNKPDKERENNDRHEIESVNKTMVDLDGVPMDMSGTVADIDDREEEMEVTIAPTSGPEADEANDDPEPDKASDDPVKANDDPVEANDNPDEAAEQDGMSCTEDSSELEEGELSSSSSSEEEEEEEEESDSASSGSSEHLPVGEKVDASDNTTQDNSEDPRMYPPSIRAMVTASSCLEVGTLFLVTCMGATVGREKSLNHAILIPDLQVSKMHAEIRYHEELQKYTIQDQASQNGSLLNGTRLGEPKTMSAQYPLTNGDVLTLGDTTLSLHIHPGVETCDDCEPGIVKARLGLELKQAQSISACSKAERESERRKNLKDIKKKYGLKNMDYENNSGVKTNPAYNDKASERRRKVGSDVEHQKPSAPASVNVAIPEDNKGHAMLRKMGWKSGEGLGREQEGITEPVSVHLRPLQSAGLGSAPNMVHSLDDVEGVKKTEKWLKAQQRFQHIPSTDSTSAAE